MKKILFVLLPFTLFLSASMISYPQEEGSDENPTISYEFEKGDVLASRDDETWNVGKVTNEGGQGKDREFQILFANGEEAWVKPANMKKYVSMIKREELRVGNSVFYTTSTPGDFHNHSIRFATFWKGKITSVGKLHRDVITVNSDEVNWKTQVLMAK